MMYKVIYSPQAEKALEKLAGKAPHIARDILDKIEWLAESAEVIKHEKLRGTRDFSLHCGQYRIPYLWDRQGKTIIIEIRECLESIIASKNYFRFPKSRRTISRGK